MTTTTDLTPRMVLNTGDFKVHHYPAADILEEYQYALVDSDADVIFETDDEAEAIEQAREAQAEVDQERAEERMNALKDEIIELVTDCESEATLKKILAQMKRAK
jgi:hypothetical protein